jgi:hypothetical protein
MEWMMHVRRGTMRRSLIEPPLASLLLLLTARLVCAVIVLRLLPSSFSSCRSLGP